MKLSPTSTAVNENVDSIQVSVHFRKRALTLYLGVLAVHLVALLFAGETIIAATKVALMPVLWLLAKGSLQALPVGWTVAILFSWIGDILLLPQWRAEVYFLAGIGAFLIAQLSYCSLLWKRGARLNMRVIVLIVFIVGSVEYGLASAAADTVLRIGIGIYGTCLLAMFFLSLSLKQSLSSFVKWGAGLFLLSDSFIALRMFVLAEGIETLVSVAVMSSYGIAQLGLAWLLALEENQRSTTF